MHIRYKFWAVLSSFLCSLSSLLRCLYMHIFTVSPSLCLLFYSYFPCTVPWLFHGCSLAFLQSIVYFVFFLYFSLLVTSIISCERKSQSWCLLHDSPCLACVYCSYCSHNVSVCALFNFRDSLYCGCRLMHGQSKVCFGACVAFNHHRALARYVDSPPYVCFCLQPSQGSCPLSGWCMHVLPVTLQHSH